MYKVNPVSFKSVFFLGLGLFHLGISVSCAAKPLRSAQKENKVTEDLLDLGLTDADYWKDPFHTRESIESKWMDEGKEVFVIGAPKIVSLKEQDSLPVLVERVATLDNMARLPLRPHAILTAMDLKTNTLHAYMAIVKTVKEPKRYDGPPLEGMGGEAFVINARKQLNLPWSPGHLLLGILMRDQVSNRVHVELKKGGYADPAIAEYLETQEKNLEPPSISPIAAITPREMAGWASGNVPPLPCYSAWSGSPALPNEPGLSLAIDRVVPVNSKVACILRGSFRLPLQERDIIKQMPSQVQNILDKHFAVVGITLLMTGSESAAPVLIPLQVPVYDAVDRQSMMATGYFTVDLAKLGNITSLEQTYFIYAFSREAMVGPIPMALIQK